MADYPILAPTLAALQGVKDLPQGTEDGSKLDDVDRQTRNWCYDFLSQFVDPTTNKLRSSAFGLDGSIPSGIIRGTNPIGLTQREIVQGSVRTEDLADGVVTAQKMASGTILNANIADGTIQGVKLANATVTADKVAAAVFTAANIADLAITDAKIAVGTITGQRLALATITNDKMAGRSALGPQLPVATEGQILVGGNGPGGDELAVKTMGGSFTIDRDGVVKYAGLAGSLVTFSRWVESANTGVGGGTSTHNTWHTRGAGNPSPQWSEEQRTRIFMELIQQGRLLFKEPGTYLIEAAAPAQGVGGAITHKAALLFQVAAGSTPDTVRAYYGLSTDAPGGSTTYSRVAAVITVTPEMFQGAFAPVISLHHYVKGSPGTGANGLGNAVNALVALSPFTLLAPEYYAEMTVLRIAEEVPTQA